MSENKTKLKKQIIDAAGNVQYTFVAHWSMVNRLERRYQAIKITQIILTAISTGGFLASILAGIPQLSWIGGLASAVALGLNLYTLSFNLPDMIKQHTDAANELWEVRERYKSLLVDFDVIDESEVRTIRESLMMAVSRINKDYPGTDEKSFTEAQAKIGNYEFVDGEAARILHIEDE